MNKIIKQKLEIFTRVLTEIPQVRYVGDPILRQVAKKATIKEGVQIGKKLSNTLKRYRQIAGIGRGFAAPQIGINKAVFVTFIDDKFQIFINPKILKKSTTKNFYKELCLSSGIMAADVKRPEWIIMEWTDENGVKQKQKFDGFLARLYQHEEAHLRGIVNLDEAEPKGIEFLTFDPLKEQLRKDQ